MLTLLGTSVMLLVLDVRLGLICLASVLFVVVLLRWFSRQSTRVFRKVRERSAAVIVHFVETMTGIRAVEAYRREPRNQEIFADLSGRYAAANVRSMRLFAIFMPGMKLIGNVTIGAVLLVGGFRVMHDTMTVGVLTAFLLYLRQFYEPMQDIGQFYNTFQSASSALEKLSGVLEQDPSVPEPVRPASAGAFRGRIDFDHVRFSYGSGEPVLPDLDLHIPAAQTVALVGTTGAGKTTIAKLISRFYDPIAGAVRLDGVDLRELSDADLRRAVVLVTQENFMFAGTVAENIEFGRPGASRDEIEAAARAVGAHDFVSLLPDGYDTSVGKQGDRLSAGQRQLVAFARAFLADPAVLILDEATSSLDIPSERLVQRALQTLLADRTAVIIAHRLSTVEIADRVLVLEQGRLIEDGPARASAHRRRRPLCGPARRVGGVAGLADRPRACRTDGRVEAMSGHRTAKQPPIGDYAILADRQTSPAAGARQHRLAVRAPVRFRRRCSPGCSMIPTPVTGASSPSTARRPRGRTERAASCSTRCGRRPPARHGPPTSCRSARARVRIPRSRTRVAIVRRIECTEGEVDIDHELVMRFDYGRVVPWVRQDRTERG